MATSSWRKWAERGVHGKVGEVLDHTDERWLQEAERRLDEIERGNVASVPAEQVFEKARSRLW
jgi:hypothetical protein